MSFIPFANSPCSLYQGIGPQWLGQACLAILPLRSGVFWCAGARGLCWFSRLRRPNNSGPGEVDPKPIQKLSAIHSETTIQKLFPPIQKLLRFRNQRASETTIQKLSRFRDYRDSETIAIPKLYRDSATITVQQIRFRNFEIQKLRFRNYIAIQKLRFRNHRDSETIAIQKLTLFRNYRDSEIIVVQKLTMIQKLSRFRNYRDSEKLSRFRNYHDSETYDSATTIQILYHSETIAIQKLSRFAKD